MMTAMNALHLPEQCGVILLKETTLFPHGGLPLFIFEPRYRKMVGDALAGDCMFGVACLPGGDEANSEEPSSLSAVNIGTIGLIRASREHPDGTSNLLLHGIIRVRFTCWHNSKDYPYASIEPLPTIPPPVEQENAAVKTLRGAVEDASASLPKEIQDSLMALLERSDSAALMSDVVAQQFVHDPLLRQQLLEEPCVGKRIATLCRYLQDVSKQ